MALADLIGPVEAPQQILIFLPGEFRIDQAAHPRQSLDVGVQGSRGLLEPGHHIRGGCGGHGEEWQS